MRQCGGGESSRGMPTRSDEGGRLRRAAKVAHKCEEHQVPDMPKPGEIGKQCWNWASMTESEERKGDRRQLGTSRKRCLRLEGDSGIKSTRVGWVM